MESNGTRTYQDELHSTGLVALKLVPFGLHCYMSLDASIERQVEHLKIPSMNENIIMMV